MEGNTSTDTATVSESTPTTVPAHRGRAWLSGAGGAAISLSLGEFIARFSESLQSLVIGVGNFLIDITPGNVIATSINNVGAWQKPLLVGGIVLASLAVGGSLGIAHNANRRALPIGFFVFGLFGGFATGRDALTSAPASWVVALIAAFVGGATAMTLHYLTRPADADEGAEVIATPGAPLSQTTNRRHALTLGSVAAGALALTAGSRIGRTSAADRAREALLETAGPGTTAAGSTTGGLQQIPLPTGEFDSVPGLSSYITPISPQDDFYLIDTAISKPRVDPSTWSLTINGEYVDTPISFTYDELLARPQVTREVTLSCVSNPIGGELVGNAVWEGVLLTDLLEEAGVQDPTNSAHQFFSRSVDGFTCGFPLPLAYDGRTAMLALKMNGEPLPIDHGFPARLVIAGLYGYVSATKWVEEISITDWDGVDGHWIPLGWGKEGPIKTMSRIDVPQNRTQFESGPSTIGGIAWSPTIGIERVEIFIGEEADTPDSVWTEVELANVESDETWVQWRYEWDATPGDWLIRVRATDKSGFTQSPIPVAPAPDGAEGFHTIIVRVA